MTNWRINTRADAQDSRHFDSGWIDQDSWKPSDGYIEGESDWRPFLVWIAGGIAVACMVVWAFKGLLQ
jgi:hypothetical protein